MQQKPDQTIQLSKKRSFSYQDLLKMKSQTVYSTIGQTINSQHPSAPRATFGKQERSTSKKKFYGKQLEKDLIGKQGIGPAAYLPIKLLLNDGKTVQGKDPVNQNKYLSVPSFSIGKEKRQAKQKKTYQYMNHDNDNIDVDKADLKRKNSSPNIMIGNQKRFSQQRLDKITPGPTYDPINKPQLVNAPKYTITGRTNSKGSDPMSLGCTTTLVGPGSYFTRPIRSSSTSSLSRVPYTSNLKAPPTVSFGKAPRTLQQLRNGIDQTYDIKTKTIMAQYDFQYDGGKGYNTGKAFMKSNIKNSAANPLQRNRIASYTIAKNSREKEQSKRGVFMSSMNQVPQSIRIQIPKF